jgi:hypothetical protein
VALTISLPSQFVDPITGLHPSNEVELSALLAVFHQLRKVAWARVKLYGKLGEPVTTADSLFAVDGIVTAEYPLFAESEEHVSVWGAMRVVLAYIRGDRTTLAFIENKLWSRFTHEGIDVELGQLARQAKYLVRCPIPEKYLILLSTEECFRARKHAEVLWNALDYQNRGPLVKGYLMYWEEILTALC